MPSEIMVKIAEENQEARKKLMEEEQHRTTFVRVIWISRWGCADDTGHTFFHFCCFLGSNKLVLNFCKCFFFFFFYIFSALSSTSQFLLGRLLTPDVFPNFPTIDVHLLDLDGDEEDLHHLKNELEHQALHLLHQVQ